MTSTEWPWVPSTGSGRGLRRAIKNYEVALQTQPVTPVPVLTPADQIGGAVEAVAQEPHRRSRWDPGRNRLQQRLLSGEADRPLHRPATPRALYVVGSTVDRHIPWAARRAVSQ
jgi:hypothetical protein